MCCKKSTALALCFIFSGCWLMQSYSQSINNSDSTYITMVAGKQYATSAAHQKKWGKHYRQEWNTAVKIRVAMLDTLAGGLTPYQPGGGRQSKTLRLRDAKGKEYVLRSIDKSFGGALPEIAQGTFIEAIANDQVSIGHPYAAVTIPPMASKAGIFHTNPQILFIPKQPALGQYNDEFGDILYLFEQRPDENWEEAPNFGNAKNIISTEKLIEKIYKDNDNKVDQAAYVRARLFDMLIGDWGRHEDQWRWAEYEEGDKKIYKPIPRDRDQVYTKFDGNMVTMIFRLGGFDHLQSFEETIKDVTSYNFPARNLDRLVANEATREDWIREAKYLQEKLPNQVIEDAIRKLPPEVFPISGPEIITKLLSRRDKLVEYANAYYQFLAKSVDIPGSDARELFVVNRFNDSTRVEVFKINKKGAISDQPYYNRSFHSSETEEIRLYGLAGDDQFRVEGKAGNSSLVRVVPGEGKDSVTDRSMVSGSKKMTRVYDSQRPAYSPGQETRLKISDDSLLTNFKYNHYKDDDRGFVFKPGLTIGMGYQIQKQKWRKQPFGDEHKWMVYYGPNRGSLAFEYTYLANQLIGKWNLEGLVRVDFPLVANFYGIGNESKMLTDVNRQFYRYQLMGVTTGVNINRLIDSTHRFVFGTAVQYVNPKDDPDRFISKEAAGIPLASMESNYFLNGFAAYQFKKSDHPVVPTKGFEFNLGAGYTQNIKETSRGFANYQSSASFYLPLLKTLILAVRAGGETVVGEPEFYQLPTLSGKDNLRGFRRQRYYGETSFYNNNELRLMLNTRNGWFNGKVGVLAFVDQGRVWQPGEKSDQWHLGYGGGIFVAPFNKILLNASYGISEEDKVLHLRIGFLF